VQYNECGGHLDTSVAVWKSELSAKTEAQITAEPQRRGSPAWPAGYCGPLGFMRV